MGSGLSINCTLTNLSKTYKQNGRAKRKLRIVTIKVSTVNSLQMLFKSGAGASVAVVVALCAATGGVHSQSLLQAQPEKKMQIRS
jgi:hypothetical protein